MDTDLHNGKTMLDDEDDEDLFGENDDDDDQQPSNDINMDTINLSNENNQPTTQNVIDEDMNMNSNDTTNIGTADNNNINPTTNNDIEQINNTLFDENMDEFKDVPQYNNKRYVPKGRADVIKVQYTQPPPKNAKYYILKLPNVINIEPEPYSKDDYFGNDLTQKGIDSTIRWQITTDPESGEQFKSSNTRFVIWSDNSKSLIIGDQVYDIDEQIYYGENDIHKNRDYLFADLMNTSSNEIKICHGKFHSRLNVKPSTSSALGKLRKNINKKQAQKLKNTKAKTISLKDRKRKRIKSDNFNQLRTEKQIYQKNLAKQKSTRMNINNTFLESGANEDDDDDGSEEDSDDESSDDNQVITGNNNNNNNNNDDIDEDSDME